VHEHGARLISDSAANKSLDASGGSVFRIIIGPAAFVKSRRIVNSNVGSLRMTHVALLERLVEELSTLRSRKAANAAS